MKSILSWFASWFALFALTACSLLPAREVIPAAVPQNPAPSAVPATIPPTEALMSYPPPDLSGRPLVWFQALPPLQVDAGRPFTGAQDFMQLFQPDAPWPTTAQRIGVYKLYAEWVGVASDEDLRQVIEFVNAHGIALGMDDGPIPSQHECGSGIESLGGPENGRKLARRIQRLGGSLRFIALDEPYYQYSLDASPGACRWPADQLARKIDAYIKSVQQVFPQVAVGDIEVLHKGMSPAAYEQWLVTFRETNGYDLSFLHMDVDYTARDWAERLLELEAFSKQQGVDFGIIFFGNWDDLTDETWLANTGERVRHYEQVNGSLPEHVLFQSWHDHPDRSLPESDPTTYTGFIKLYFEDRASLGFRRQGAGANLAFGKAVRASHSLPGQPPGYAVDGDPGTTWGAGDFAPQWLEIDLGAPQTVGEIRLRLSQSPAGRTVHKVYARGPGSGDAFVLLATFDGDTDNLDLLVYTLPEPLQNVQFIRVETVTSPSWIGFGEIEVIAATNSFRISRFSTS